MMMYKTTKNPPNTQEEALEKQFRSLNDQKELSFYLNAQLFYLPAEKRLYNPNFKDALLMRKQYQVSMNCSNTLVARMKDGKVVFQGKRCKNRFCTVCLRARTAKLINAYEEPLSQIDDLYFVTLTAPTVTTEELPKRMDEFRQWWEKIKNSKYWRKNRPSGIRKAECTLRPNDRYHYHFHILIGGEENAEWLINKWLELSPTSKRSAQDMRKVGKDKKGAIKEMFKYFTKLVSKGSTGETVGIDAVARELNGQKEGFYVDLPRLDYVLYLMRKKRVFQPFGGIKAVDEDDFEVGEDLGLPLEYKDRSIAWRKKVGFRDSETAEQLVEGYKAPSWINILVGDVDEVLLRKAKTAFNRELEERGIPPYTGILYRRKGYRSREYQEYYDGDVDYGNFDGWGALKSEVATEPQEPEPPKREREDLEAPPLFEPMGITDRRLSGCRCVSAERHSKGIEIYLDM